MKQTDYDLNAQDVYHWTPLTFRAPITAAADDPFNYFY